jgi:hypothetical protein
MLGSNLPAGLGIQEAMGPLLMGGQLQSMVGQVSSIASAITNGTIDPVAAISQVAGMTGAINGVLDTHTNAFTTIQNAVVDMAHANSIVSLITSGPSEFAPIANSLIQPQFIPRSKPPSTRS